MVLVEPIGIPPALPEAAMTTTTTPQSGAATRTEPNDLSVARRIYSAAEALDDLAVDLSGTRPQTANWNRLRDFLGEVKASAFRGEVSPEELTGWAVSMTFAAVDTRIRSVDATAYFLVRFFGEACLLGARYQEDRANGTDPEEALSEFNAAVDFVIDGVPSVEVVSPTVWKQAA